MMTDHYAVIGNPIKHSKSPAIHKSLANQTHQDITYTRLCCAENQFINTVNQFREDGGKGLNVTLPFKQQAFDYADELSDEAKAAGAVNTLWFRDDGSCYGHNTDGIGLIRDLSAHGIKLANKKILLLGAGGAARGALLPLLQEQPAEIVVANRTVEKAAFLVNRYKNPSQPPLIRGGAFTGSPPSDKEALTKRFPSDKEALTTRLHPDKGGLRGVKISCNSLNELMPPAFDVIINATSASLQNVNLPLSEKLISKTTICYDMVYQNDLTCFLEWAKHSGAKTLIDGKGMLLQQAAESFYLWRGVRPIIANY